MDSARLNVAIAAVRSVPRTDGASALGSAVVDNNQTNVTLTTGLPQSHDLDQAGGGDDQDWMVVPTIAFHSYEARISASGIASESPIAVSGAGISGWKRRRTW